MSFLQEFKAFALKGNVADMAVGVIIGGAFGKIVTALVNNIIMPPIGLLLGKTDFSNLFINLSNQPVATMEQAQKLGLPVLAYGLFLNAVLDFIIVAFAIFIIISKLNKLRPAPEDTVAGKDCPYCLSVVNINAIRCPHCTSDLTK